MAILLNDMWHSAVIGIGYVSSRILKTRSSFQGAEISVVVGGVPNEGDGEEGAVLE